MRIETFPYPYAVLCHVSGLDWVRCLWEVDWSPLVYDVEVYSRRPLTLKELSVTVPVQAAFGRVALVHAHSWVWVPCT